MGYVTQSMKLQKILRYGALSVEGELTSTGWADYYYKVKEDKVDYVGFVDVKQYTYNAKAFIDNVLYPLLDGCL